MKFRLFSILINLNGYNGHNGIENIVSECTNELVDMIQILSNCTKKNRYII